MEIIMNKEEWERYKEMCSPFDYENNTPQKVAKIVKKAKELHIYSPNEEKFRIIWGIEDIISAAEDNGLREQWNCLSEAERENIVKNCRYALTEALIQEGNERLSKIVPEEIEKAYTDVP